MAEKVKDGSGNKGGGPLRLGSFVIEPRKIAGRAYGYRIVSDGRNFVLEAGIGTALHALIDRCMGDEGMWDYLSCVVSMNYVMASVLPDEEFLEGFAGLVHGVFGRMAKLHGGGEDESEEEILLGERAREVLREADRINGTDLLGELDREVRAAAVGLETRGGAE